MADTNKFYAAGAMPSNGQNTGVVFADVKATADDTIGIGSYPLFKIQPNQVVLQMGYTIVGVESTNASATIAIGDGSDVDAYLTAETVAAGAGSVIAADSDPAVGTDKTITLTVAVAALGDADLTFWAVVANVESPIQRGLTPAL